MILGKIQKEVQKKGQRHGKKIKTLNTNASLPNTRGCSTLTKK